MKHRFTVPSELAADRLSAWLHGRSWQIVREELQYLGDGGAILHVMIQPQPTRDPALAGRSWTASISVCSGATLIYDDVEQSMGVTLLAEPRDAVPVDQPAEFSLTEAFFDPSVVADEPPRRWPRRPR